MKERIGKSFGFLRTTAIGGVLYLFPVVIIGVLLGYVFNFVVVVNASLQKHLPVETKMGMAILFLIAILVVLLLCFLCGLITRRAIARKFSSTIEKQLVMFYPRYAVYKDILAGNLGGQENVPSLKPVSVQYEGHTRLAFESDRLNDGRAVIYLPGAPDPWNGFVILVDSEQVEPLNIPFAEAVAVFERLGRDSKHVIAGRLR